MLRHVIKISSTIIFGILTLVLSDAFTIFLGIKTGVDVVMVMGVILGFAYGLVTGRIFGKWWVLAGIAPLVYFGYFSYCMQTLSLFTGGTHVPFVSASILSGAYTGYTIIRRRRNIVC